LNVVKLGVVDYGVGNVGSVFNALRRVNADPHLIKDINDLSNVDAIILPGVGSFNAAVVNLVNSGIAEELNRFRGSVPILGICLGLQLMFRGSDEGKLSGLGWYGEWVRRINGPRVPHIGWGYVKVNGECGLAPTQGYYYFMHSYAVTNPTPSKPYIGITKYGNSTILSILCDDDKLTYGTQFHPEKSSKLGLSILRSFISITKR
jgi:glutamine amidotransferase